MTIGTAMVARTRVRRLLRRTGDRVVSESPRARLRTVRVGKTDSQIIRASWCLVGGPAWDRRGLGFGSDTFLVRLLGFLTSVAVRSGKEAVLLVGVDGVADVLVDEVGVNRD